MSCKVLGNFSRAQRDPNLGLAIAAVGLGEACYFSRGEGRGVQQQLHAHTLAHMGKRAGMQPGVGLFYAWFLCSMR